MSTTKNVFISHHGKDDDHIQKLKNLLSPKGYNLKNYSVDSSKPNNANNEQYIKSQLRSLINKSGTMIVLIGKETHNRDYVNWEIEQANKQGKRIVGVHINGEGEADIPENFKDYGDALVGWTGDRIIDALEGKINNWENPDGSQYTPSHHTPRSNC